MITLSSFVSISSSFIFGICFSLAAYFIFFPKRKLNEDEIILFIFWILIALHFFIIGLLLVVFYTGFVELSYKFLYPLMFGLGVTGVVGGYYALTRIFKGFWEKVVILILLLTGFIFFINVIFPQIKPTLRYGEPYFTASGHVLFNYVGAGIIFALLLLILINLWLDFKKGKITFSNLAVFYRTYALIIFGAISLPRLLYFIPRPWFLTLFYFLIPYLNYLSTKEQLKMKKMKCQKKFL